MVSDVRCQRGLSARVVADAQLSVPGLKLLESTAYEQRSPEDAASEPDDQALATSVVA
jgi:hypothetical protein